jgi:hypothetical protein
MTNTVANTIFQQLGGNRFVAMTGAKNFLAREDALSFRIGRNKTRCNYVKVIYNAGLDDYSILFGYVSANKGLKELEKIDGLYFDDLQPKFTAFTGLYTKL